MTSKPCNQCKNDQPMSAFTAKRNVCKSCRSVIEKERRGARKARDMAPALVSPFEQWTPASVEQHYARLERLSKRKGWWASMDMNQKMSWVVPWGIHAPEWTRSLIREALAPKLAGPRLEVPSDCGHPWMVVDVLVETADLSPHADE